MARLVMRTAAALLLLPVLAPAANGQSVHDSIRAAWQARQDAVKSASVRYTCESIRTKGSMSRSLPQLKSATPIPLEDTRSTIAKLFVLDGSNVRLESDGVQWSGIDYRPIQLVTLHDGAWKRQLEAGVDGGPLGKILPDREYWETRGQSVRPLSLAFRPLATGFKLLTLDDLNPTGVQLDIAGRPCLQFILRGGGEVRWEYWLDPGRDWVVARQAVSSKSDRTQLDVQYVADATCGWVPASWEFRSLFADGTPAGTERYKVDSCTVNPSVEASQFELTFPAGTKVIDQRQPSAPAFIAETPFRTPTAGFVEPKEYNWKVLVGVGLLGVGAVVVGCWAYRRRVLNRS